jgi:hypothetical protein
MKLLKIISLLPICLILQSCIYTHTNVGDDAALKQNEGIIVTKLHSNLQRDNLQNVWEDLVYTYKMEGDSYKVNQFVVPLESELKVISLPAGEYKWDALMRGGGRLELSRDSGFTVKKGRIIYIGDIITDYRLANFGLGSAKITVKNNFDNIKKEFSSKYPNLSARYKISAEITKISAQ